MQTTRMSHLVFWRNSDREFRLAILPDVALRLVLGLQGGVVTVRILYNGLSATFRTMLPLIARLDRRSGASSLVLTQTLGRQVEHRFKGSVATDVGPAQASYEERTAMPGRGRNSNGIKMQFANSPHLNLLYMLVGGRGELQYPV